MPEYAVCETVNAISLHLRVLTETGRHPSGGADSPTLCGLIAAWDTRVPTPSPNKLTNWLCSKCQEIYQAQPHKEDPPHVG
jgi:hypothetical protein